MDTSSLLKYFSPVVEFVEQHPRLSVCLGVTGLSLGYYIATRHRNLPPGPMPLPILGNLHLLSSTAHKDIMKMREKYGDVFTLYFGSE